MISYICNSKRKRWCERNDTAYYRELRDIDKATYQQRQELNMKLQSKKLEVRKTSDWTSSIQAFGQLPHYIQLLTAISRCAKLLRAAYTMVGTKYQDNRKLTPPIFKQAYPKRKGLPIILIPKDSTDDETLRASTPLIKQQSKMRCLLSGVETRRRRTKRSCKRAIHSVRSNSSRTGTNHFGPKEKRQRIPKTGWWVYEMSWALPCSLHVCISDSLTTMGFEERMVLHQPVVDRNTRLRRRNLIKTKLSTGRKRCCKLIFPLSLNYDCCISEGEDRQHRNKRRRKIGTLPRLYSYSSTHFFCLLIRWD